MKRSNLFVILAVILVLSVLPLFIVGMKFTHSPAFGLPAAINLILACLAMSRAEHHMGNFN